MTGPATQAVCAITGTHQHQRITIRAVPGGWRVNLEKESIKGWRPVEGRTAATVEDAMAALAGHMGAAY